MEYFWKNISKNIENFKVFKVGWLFGFYGILTFVGYLMLNPFLYK